MKKIGKWVIGIGAACAAVFALTAIFKKKENSCHCCCDGCDEEDFEDEDIASEYDKAMDTKIPGEE